MRAIGIVGLILLGLALGLAVLVGATFVVLWNVTDIQNVGVNFWNIFWLVVVAAAITGGASKASS